MYATLVGGYDVTAAILKEVQYIYPITSFPPNDTVWCHHGHGLSISQWEFMWGV